MTSLHSVQTQCPNTYSVERSGLLSGKRVIPLVRVSSVRGRSGESFHSPGEQASVIQRWGAIYDPVLLDPMYELDQSGGAVFRPKLEEAVRRVEAGDADGLVFARLDRFSRDLLTGKGYVERLKQANGRVFFVDMPMGPGGPMADLQLDQLLAWATYQLGIIRDGWDRCVQHAVEDLGIHPTRPNVGYVKGPQTRRFVPHPTVAPLISELFRRAAAGEAWCDLAAWMNETGTRTNRDSQFTARGVKDVVRNRVYLGEARKGSHFCADAHPPLTTFDTFKRAQRVGRQNASTGADEPALLAGIARCAGCRYVMSAFRRRDGERFYQCRKNHGAGLCSQAAAIKASALEDLAERAFWDVVGNLRVNTVRNRRQTTQLLSEVELCRSELAQYQSAAVQRLLGDAWEEGIEERVAALQAAEAAAQDAGRTEELQRTTLQKEWTSLSVRDRNAVLRAGLGAVFVRKATCSGRAAEPAEQRAVIALPHQLDADLPRRGHSATSLRPFDWPVM